MAKKKRAKPRVRQTTREQFTERVNIVRRLLYVDGAKKHQIKKVCKEKWDVEWRQVERYIAEAKKESLAACDVDRRELLAQILEVQWSIVYDSDATANEKLGALQQIISVTGVAAAAKVHVDVVSEQRVQVKATLEDLRKDKQSTDLVKQLMERAKALG